MLRMAGRMLPRILAVLVLAGCAPTVAPPAGRVVEERAQAAEANLRQVALQGARALGCPDAVALEPEPPRPWRPRGVTFTSGGRPVSLAWLQAVPLSFCPVTRRVVVLASQPAGAPLQLGVAQVGDTLTDPQLQGQVVESGLRPLLAESFADCGQARVVDTTVLQAPGTMTTAWMESWTVAGCDRRMQVEVTFRPGPTGTAFSLRSG